MDDACTVRQRYIIVRNDAPCVLALVVDREVKQGLIVDADQLAALERSKLFYLFPENVLCKRLCKDKFLSFIQNDYIVLIRIYAQADIAGKSPRRSRPCDEAFASIDKRMLFIRYCRESNEYGCFLDILVTLSNLMAGKRSAAAGAIGNYLVSLV